jgi:large subunit ribosomal protein L6
MVEGVTQGFEKKLELNGVGYRMAIQGKQDESRAGLLSSQWKWKSQLVSRRRLRITVFTISGIDKHQVGQFTAIIRDLKPVEPYKGKGFRYAGEIVRRKEGKKTTT